jgi:hypothetical protein
MRILYSCRNCVHNCVQGMYFGAGAGYCLQHQSVLREPEETTCKYLHRKDLPIFVVEEGVRDHAAEFAAFPGIASLRDHRRIDLVPYSERHCWVTRSFDPLLHAVALYYKSRPAWIHIQMFASESDGRRMLAYTSLIRRYMARCGRWQSSYRLVLALLSELNAKPKISDASLTVGDSVGTEEARSDAEWEVLFARLSAVQEYGWHAGIEELMWVTDQLDGGLANYDWQTTQDSLTSVQSRLIDMVIDHADREGAFFPERDGDWPATVDEDE